jgi:integrase/recombinase XerD
VKTRLRIYDEEKEGIKNLLQVFIFSCQAKNLSEKTISWYKQILKQFFVYVDIKKPRLIKAEHIRDYLTHLKTKRIVNNLTGKVDKIGLSSHSIRDNFSAIRVFFNFLEGESYIQDNPVKPLKAPRQEQKIINTLSIEQIKKLLNIPDKKTYLGYRDYVILYTFLDTGIRLNELCNLRIDDINYTENYFIVYGKGKKERIIPFSLKLKRLLLKLIEKSQYQYQDYFFIDRYGDKINDNAIRQMIKRLGKKVGIKNVRLSPHTLRHTFAKMWILNGGDTFSLQKILGHTTMDMVRNYVNLASSDVQIQHRKFSPLDRIGL